MQGLVLDLDHTLLNSATYAELDAESDMGSGVRWHAVNGLL